jgi:hypothetical protein
LAGFVALRSPRAPFHGRVERGTALALVAPKAVFAVRASLARSLRVLPIALTLLACACGHAAREESACGSQSAALYHGSSDPAPLELTAAQQDAVVTLESSAGGVFCTATLISAKWALGAAHCAARSCFMLRVNRRLLGTRRLVLHPELDASLMELETAVSSSITDDSGQARVAGVLDRGSDTCLGVDVYTRADQLDVWIRRTLQRAGGCD